MCGISASDRLTNIAHTANGAAIQDYLHQKTGQRTVPNIFINQKHIGGCDDLLAAERSGALQKALA